MPTILEEERRRRRPEQGTSGFPTVDMSRPVMHVGTRDAAIEVGRQAIEEDRLASEDRGRASAFPETQTLLATIDAAELNPTPNKVRAATSSLAAFPYQDLYFQTGIVDPASQKTLDEIRRINNLVTGGKITLKEASDRISPLRDQLEATKKRRDAREAPLRAAEHRAAVETEAQFVADRSATRLEKGDAELAAIDSEISKLEGQPENAAAIAAMQTKRDALEVSLAPVRLEARAAEIAADGARQARIQALAPDEHGAAWKEIRDRLAEARTPEEQAVFDKARAEATGEPLATPTPTPEPSPEETARINRAIGRKARVVQGEERRRLNIEYDKRIKAAKTDKGKLELRKELEARLRGETTPEMESRIEVADYDPLAGYSQSKELLDIHAKHNAKLTDKIARIQAAMVNATGQRAKVLEKQFDKIAAQIDRNLKSQSKVIDDKAAAELKESKAQLKISKRRLKEYERRGKQADIDREKAKVKEAEDDVQKRVDAEQEKFEERAAEDRKTKEVRALKQMEIDDKRLTAQQKTARDARNAKAKRDVGMLEKDYDTARDKYETAVAEREEFIRERDRAVAEGVAKWGVKDGTVWVTKKEGVTAEGIARHTILAKQTADAKTEMRKAHKTWTDADDKRIAEIGQTVDASDAAKQAWTDAWKADPKNKNRTKEDWREEFIARFPE